jgi:hypothetical protein
MRPETPSTPTYPQTYPQQSGDFPNPSFYRAFHQVYPVNLPLLWEDSLRTRTQPTRHPNQQSHRNSAPQGSTHSQWNRMEHPQPMFHVPPHPLTPRAPHPRNLITLSSSPATDPRTLPAKPAHLTSRSTSHPCDRMQPNATECNQMQPNATRVASPISATTPSIPTTYPPCNEVACNQKQQNALFCPSKPPLTPAPTEAYLPCNQNATCCMPPCCTPAPTPHPRNLITLLGRYAIRDNHYPNLRTLDIGAWSFLGHSDLGLGHSLSPLPAYKPRPESAITFTHARLLAWQTLVTH